MRLRPHQVTVDIDNRKIEYGMLWYPLAKATYTLRWMGFEDVWVLRTEHGWHVRAWAPRRLSWREQYVLRAWLGDDPERLWMDEAKPGELRGTLWMAKDGTRERLLA